MRFAPRLLILALLCLWGTLCSAQVPDRRGEIALHHLIDPLTGVSVESPWRTASVVAATCVDANTASTAAIIRGRAAPGWLTGLGLPARLVDEAGTVHTVGGWPAASS